MSIRAADVRLSVRVGAAVIVVAIVAIVYLLFLRDRLFLGDVVRVRVTFRHVGSLQEGADVVVAGRRVGIIEAIQLVPAGGAVAVARIDADRASWVPENGDFFVSSRGVFSERYLEVGPPLDGSPPSRPAFDGMEVAAAEPPSLDRVWIEAWENLQVARAFMDAVRPEAGALVDALDELSATIDAVEPAPGAYDQLAGHVSKLAAEARVTWLTLSAGGATPSDLSALSDRVSGTITKVRGATGLLRARIAAVSGDLVRVRGQIDRARPDLEKKLAKALDAVDGALAKIDAVNAEVQGLLAMIERGEGTIGRLMSDPEFPEDAKALGKILKRQPWRVIGHPQDAKP